MTIRSVLCASSLAILASCTVPQITPRDGTEGAIATRPLKVASWNLEFLAEKDGAGCEPRTDADYVAMRQIVDTLDADVIAFQEAENEAAAARVFNPSRYTIVMEQRPGAASGSCGASTRSSSLSARRSASQSGGVSHSTATRTSRRYNSATRSCARGLIFA